MLRTGFMGTEGNLGTVHRFTYNRTSEPTQGVFGSGDSDNFAYDANTGRISQDKFNVNGSTVTGTLGWSSNGTLRTLGMVDQFTAANTQTCTNGSGP